jgi:hypothetical protein
MNRREFREGHRFPVRHGLVRKAAGLDGTEEGETRLGTFRPDRDRRGLRSAILSVVGSFA